MTRDPSPVPPNGAVAPGGGKKERLASLDAFRGFTILGMILVIAVAAGGYQWEEEHLPQKMSWMGSLPVSTWFHADVGGMMWVAEQREAGLSEEAIRAMPEYQIRNIGVTFTDLIAPWFVFIVGVCVPLSRARRGGAWWGHVSSRTLMLIVAGIVYISLVIQQISWWWGVLQAIGVAYFCAALTARLPSFWKWVAVFGVAILHLLMTELTVWWTGAWKGIDAPFGTLTNPNGNWLRPLTIHCLPWLSISYGIMAMIGVLVGEEVLSRDPRRIARRCLTAGLLFVVLGWIIHRIGFATENLSLAMNKPDVTASFAFFTAGLGALVFLGFYWLIDVMKIGWWAVPLAVIGMNPLLAYFLMIVQRRVLEVLGLIGAFNRVTEQNAFVQNWAALFGDPDSPSHAVLVFFHKGGYMGLFWGLVWTAILWMIVRWCNRRGLFWKL